MCYLKICLKWKVKKTIVEELKLQNHIEHLWKNPKHYDNLMNVIMNVLCVNIVSVPCVTFLQGMQAFVHAQTSKVRKRELEFLIMVVEV
jgi:hypothetical protein